MVIPRAERSHLWRNHVTHHRWIARQAPPCDLTLANEISQASSPAGHFSQLCGIDDCPGARAWQIVRISTESLGLCGACACRISAQMGPSTADLLCPVAGAGRDGVMGEVRSPSSP